MGHSSFGQQFLALVKRNLHLKARNKLQTIPEFIIPLYFIGIMTGLRFAMRSPSVPEVPHFDRHQLQYSSVPPGGILITPNTTIVQSFMENVSLNLQGKYNLSYFDTDHNAFEYYRNNSRHVVAGVNFDDGLLNTFEYTIRMPITRMVPAGQLYVAQGQCLPGRCEATKYFSSGFCKLQSAINTELIRFRTGNSNFSKPVIAVQLMPKPGFASSGSMIQVVAAFFYVLAFMFYPSLLTVNLVAEKEKKIKEVMKMMGMRQSAFWCSWGVVYAGSIFIVCILATLVAWAGRTFEQSNMFLLFLILMLYGLTLICLSFIISTLFNKAEIAGTFAGFLSLFFSLLYLAIRFTRTGVSPEGPVSVIPTGVQVALCLLSPIALTLAIDQGLYLDSAQGGMHFHNMNIGQMPLYASILMLFLDFFLYGLLAVYLDNILPSEYGKRRSPFFCFKRSFWCGSTREDQVRRAAQAEEQYGIQLSMESEDQEPVPANMASKEVIKLLNIRKVFKKKKKEEIKAVDGVSLGLYEGQITALLGHNGAGKTTLINIMTGLTAPTDGTATIYGMDISDGDDMAEIRSMTGVCAQHSVLFDTLTCREHLDVYANLKGVPRKEIKEQIIEALKEVDLLDQLDTWAEELSGGQKRKLSVAIALIGDPKLIFLDEPTAGMDPYSRRHLWSVLQKRKEGRVILLTTHYMDEADILADRKAFISKGKLQCCGSSLFLKNRFGVGYHLTMVAEPGANIDDISSLVNHYIPDSGDARSHGNELSITLPLGSVDKFAELFGALEGRSESQTKAENVGIRSYGIAMTTLEEVFLKLEESEGSTDGEIEQQQALNENTEAKMEDIQDKFNQPKNDVRPEAKQSDLKQHLSVLCLIKLRLALRHPGAVFMRLVLPTIFIIMGATFSRFLNFPPAGVQTSSFDFLPGHYVKLHQNNVKPLQDSNKKPAFMYGLSPGGTNYSDFVRGLYEQGVELNETKYYSDFLKQLSHMGVNITEVEAETTDISSNVTALFNDTAVHSLPIVINMIYNSVLKMATNSLFDQSVNISTSTHPWPNLAPRQFSQSLFQSTIWLGMPLAMVAGTFVVGVTLDREKKCRSQLRISGVSVTEYWLAHFILDFAQIFCVGIIMIIICLAFQTPAFLQGGAITIFLLVLLLYLPIAQISAYAFSFAFTKAETAATVSPGIFNIVAIIPYTIVGLVDQIWDPAVAAIIHTVLCFVHPLYVIIGAIFYISKVYTEASYVHGVNVRIPFGEYFKLENNIVTCIFALLFHYCWMVFLIRLLEIKSTGGEARDVCPCKRNNTVSEKRPNHDIPEHEDFDVAQERSKVNNMNLQPEAWPPERAIVIKNLRKEFSTHSKAACGCRKNAKEVNVKTAVRNNTFTVDTGEVFGLLGPNGAGKSTTLNMIIAETGTTAGTIIANGKDIHSSLSDAFKVMGYCPQYDALWDFMTLREHIECYATLRGMDKDIVKTIADNLIMALRVKDHADTKAKDLSGGTKRKLSYAISMLGSPKIVLLDEPSTGLDPKSKRFLWDTISSSFSGTERGAILTTHYMDEADALCSRIAIMVNGQMECLGSGQHLKNKFGSGYILEVKLSSTEGDQDLEECTKKLNEFVLNLFPLSIPVESFMQRSVYKIPREDIPSLSKVFSSLEDGKRSIGIEDYSFTQATLEQVFLEFARQQLEEGTEQDVNFEHAAVEARKLRNQQASPSHSKTPLQGSVNQAFDSSGDICTNL